MNLFKVLVADMVLKVFLCVNTFILYRIYSFVLGGVVEGYYC